MGRHDVCLDTGAGAGVFMSVVNLNNLREDDELMGISGINGDEATLNCEGMGDSVGRPVNYHLHCTINAVSYSAVKDFARKYYQREDEDIFRI